MKKLIKFFRPLIVVGMRALWFVTRPKTSGAKVIIICKNEILLIMTTYGYSYGLPGGGIKKGESPDKAAKREALEEVGIQLAEVTALPAFITQEEFKKDTVYGFYANVSSKEYRLDNLEIDLAEWHSINNLPKLGPVTQKIIDLYLNSQI